MDDTDKMCVYEGYNKARECGQETLVKYEVHRYMNTNEWINAADGAILYYGTCTYCTVNVSIL